MAFKKSFTYLFLEGEGREEEREGENHQCGCLSHALCWGWTCNPGMCPYWELNQWLFDLQAGTQSTEPHQPGLNGFFEIIVAVITPRGICLFIISMVQPRFLKCFNMIATTFLCPSHSSTLRHLFNCFLPSRSQSLATLYKYVSIYVALRFWEGKIVFPLIFLKTICQCHYLPQGPFCRAISLALLFLYGLVTSQS